MNYTQVYRRYEMKPSHPELNFQPGQVKSGRKIFSVHKNMQTSGLGPGTEYYLQRHQHVLGQKERNTSDLGTYSSPQFRKKPDQSDQPYDSSPPPQNFEPAVASSGPFEFSKPQKYDSYDPPKSDPVVVQKYDSSQLQRYSGYDDQRYQPVSQSQKLEKTEPQFAQQKTEASVLESKDGNEELQRLREQLRLREEELSRYRDDPGTKHPASLSPAKNIRSLPAEDYDRINKALWDKQVSSENRKITVQALDYQVSEKQMKQQWEVIEKEQEQMQRIEHLRRLREVEMQERVSQMSRAKEYKEHLDMQRQLQHELLQQERVRSRAPAIDERPPPMRTGSDTRTYAPRTEYEKVALEFYDQNSSMPTATSLTPFRLTKKSPKTISYNPITGIVRDTSIYLQSNIPRPVLKSYLPEPRNLETVVPDYSRLPAFQQPSFTAKNPKVIMTDPITMKLPKRDFQTPEFFADAALFYGVDLEETEKRPTSHLADLGTMVMNSGSPAVLREPIVGKGSGFNYKDTRQLVQ